MDTSSYVGNQTEIEGNRPGAMWVLKAQWDAQYTIPNSKMVIIRDLDKYPDGHASNTGLLDVGRIFAEAYLERFGIYLTEGGYPPFNMKYEPN